GDGAPDARRSPSSTRCVTVNRLRCMAPPRAAIMCRSPIWCTRPLNLGQISHKEVDQIPIRPCGVLVVGLVENDRLFFPTPLRVRGEPTTDSIATGERHDCGLKLSGRGLAGDH